MKKLTKLIAIISAIILGIGFTSCTPEVEEDLDYASHIAGTYVGTADITFSGIEYSKIKGCKVIVNRSSNNYAIVSFRYADGSDLFSDDDVYEIEKYGTLYRLKTDTSSIEDIDIIDNQMTAKGYVYVDDMELDFEFVGIRE